MSPYQLLCKDQPLSPSKKVRTLENFIFQKEPFIERDKSKSKLKAGSEVSQGMQFRIKEIRNPSLPSDVHSHQSAGVKMISHQPLSEADKKSFSEPFYNPHVSPPPLISQKAVVRGYLIRKRLQGIRSKYESIVKEIEGDLDWVQWTGHFFPRPVFLSKSAKKSTKQFNREKVKIDKPQKQDAQYFQEISQSKQMCDFEMQFPSRLLAEAERKIGEVGQQAVDAHSGNVCSLSGENEEGGEPSNASSDWSSTVLGMESPRMSQESHFPKAPEMFRGMPGLQKYRKHLAMELLWLQQAIASRKNYLILKQRLGKAA